MKLLKKFRQYTTTFTAAAVGLLLVQSSPSLAQDQVEAQNAAVREQLVREGDLYMIVSVSEFVENINAGIESMRNLTDEQLQDSPFTPDEIVDGLKNIVNSLNLEGIKGVGKSLHTRESGLKEGRTFLLAEKSGLFSVLNTQPLDAALFSYVPVDADMVIGMNFNTTQVLPLLEEIYSGLPNKGQTFDEALAQEDLTRAELEQGLRIAGLPMVFWFKGWRRIQNGPNGILFSPEPEIGLIVRNFSDVEWLNSTMAEAENFFEIQDERFITAYQLDVMDGSSRSILVGILQNNDLLLRFDSKPTKETTVSNPLNLQARLQIDEQFHSFIYMTDGFDASVNSLMAYAEQINPSAPARSIAESIKFFANGNYFPQGGITYRTSTDAGVLWKTLSLDLNPASMMNTAIFGAASPLILATAVPGFVKARETSRLRACQENQLKLDGATQQYMLEENLPSLEAMPFAGKAITDATVPADMFGRTGYIRTMPVCPAGGEYIYYPSSGPQGQAAYCNHDHNNDGILDHPFPGIY